MNIERATIPVSGIRGEVERGTSRVSARVGDETLWFESESVELTPSPEAFASALLVPSLESRRTLVFDEPLQSAWLSNCRQLVRMYNEWWGYEERVPLSGPGEPQRGSVSLGTALCFTAGVDSFYTLLRSGQKIDFLVSGQGFVDTPLSDSLRLRSLEDSFREIADKTGTTALFIRTNFLDLPLVRQTSWERSHGGILVALGHLLSKVAARLLISSSYRYADAKPWGSHWRTDPLGSSASLQVIHVGAELQRYEKLWAIADEPLVQKHLHVCWENHKPTGNCSRCDKCLRTRMQLLECGKLNDFSCFDGEETLVGDIESLPTGDGKMRTYRRIIDEGRADRDILRALENLIRRTEKARAEAASAPVVRRSGVWRLIQRLTR